MENVHAGDIMVPLDMYPHIPYWFSIRQAIAEMESAEIETNGRKSIPRVVLVFDETYRLMGFIRRRDILHGLLPGYLLEDSDKEIRKTYDIHVDPHLSEIFDTQGEDMRELSNKPISSVMQPIVHSVQCGDTLLKIVQEIVVQNVYMLPVMENGKIVGVIRSLDVLHAVAKLVL
ncbi:MAG TPA: CBS domain-containing protein [Bacteroidetes bacterium]|nr:CBS domain protein [bacterium BMS3Bbin04]HDO65701.1 CBS domain-containing protein [Bacteroidota bacterium]HEX04826.1 CBS domain-containing protein [Bacteroidota bacterium]